MSFSMAFAGVIYITPWVLVNYSCLFWISKYLVIGDFGWARDCTAPWILDDLLEYFFSSSFQGWGYNLVLFWEEFPFREI